MHTIRNYAINHNVQIYTVRAIFLYSHSGLKHLLAETTNIYMYGFQQLLFVNGSILQKSNGVEITRGFVLRISS